MAHSSETILYTKTDINNLIQDKTGYPISDDLWDNILLDNCTSTKKVIFLYMTDGTNKYLYVLYNENNLSLNDLDFKSDEEERQTVIKNLTEDTVNVAYCWESSGEWAWDGEDDFSIDANSTEIVESLIYEPTNPPFQNSIVYDKSNVLAFLLADIADAIRVKKPPTFVDQKIEPTVENLNTLFTQKTTYGVDSESDFVYSLQNYNENYISIFLYIPHCWFSEWGYKVGLIRLEYDGRDLTLDDITINQTSNGIEVSSNIPGYEHVIGYDMYMLDENTNKWGISDISGGISPDDTKEWDALGADPFLDTARVRVIEEINAQDFPAEILNLRVTYEPIPITEDFSVETDVSRVPGPYDAEGYNYNAQAPEKRNELEVELGDLTGYTSITFHWDINGTANNYGDIAGSYIFDETETTLFSISSAIGTGGITSGTVTIDCSQINESKSIKFKVYARSRSNYRNYSTHTILNISNLGLSTS